MHDTVMSTSRTTTSVNISNAKSHGSLDADIIINTLPAGAVVAKGCKSGAPAIQPGSPGAKAGLRAHDVITSVGNIRLSNAISLEQAIVVHNPGDVVALRVWRPNAPGSTHGSYLTLTITLGRSHTQTQ